MLFRSLRSCLRPYLVSSPRRQAHIDTRSMDLFRSEMFTSWTQPMLSRSDKEQLEVSAVIIDKDSRITAQPGPLDKQALCHRYGLQPRDLRTLDCAVRDISPNLLIRAKGIVYTSSVARVIVARDHVILFDAPALTTDESVTSQTIPRVLAEALAPLIVQLGAPSMSMQPQTDDYGRAFELRALEALLLLLVRGYSKILRKVDANCTDVIERLQTDVSHNDIRDLANVRGQVEDFVSRVGSFRDCLSSILREDDHDLASMYLTAKHEGKPRGIEEHDEVELMLESVCQRADEIAEAASGLATRVRATDSALTLVLSATRNRLLHLELKLEMLVLGLTFVNAVFACFGQNLISHLEHSAYMFWSVTACAAVTAIVGTRIGMLRLRKVRRSQLASLVGNGHSSVTSLPLGRAKRA